MDKRLKMEREQRNFCRLCLNTVNDKNCTIEKHERELLSVVLLKFDLEESNIQVICNNCSEKLSAAFDFKKRCLYTEDIIAPYVSSKASSSVNLKDIYLKENGSEQLINILDDQNICRLCMRLVNCEFMPLHEADVDMVHIYIPEINFSITKDPVICTPCFDLLGIHGSFVKNCLNVDKNIKNNYNVNKVGDGPSQLQSFDSPVQMEYIEVKSEINGQGEVEGLDKSKDIKSESEENKQWKDKFFKIEHVAVKSEGNEQESSPPPQQPCLTNNACVAESNNTSPLKKHIRTVKKSPSQTEILKCCVCQYESKDESDLEMHMSVHKDEAEPNQFRCNCCAYKTENLHNLALHMEPHRRMSQPHWFECDLCCFKCKSRNKFETHVAKHKDVSSGLVNDIVKSGPVKFKCDQCEFQTGNQRNLNRHKTKHKEPSELPVCEICSATLKNKRALTQHMLIHKSLNIKCDKCEYKTTSHYLLNRHKITHKDASEIQWQECEICNTKLKTSDSLRRHMLKHVDEQVYKCEKCSFQTKHHGHYSVHKLKHK